MQLLADKIKYPKEFKSLKIKGKGNVLKRSRSPSNYFNRWSQLITKDFVLSGKLLRQSINNTLVSYGVLFFVLLYKIITYI